MAKEESREVITSWKVPNVLEIYCKFGSKLRSRKKAQTGEVALCPDPGPRPRANAGNVKFAHSLRLTDDYKCSNILQSGVSFV